MRRAWVIGAVAVVGFFAYATPGWAGKEVFTAPGNNFGVWRLTFDPTVRDWANYHNTQCFSPDGRYVCYSRWPAGSKTAATVHLFDLHTDEDRLVGPGVSPRWAKHHNWLFYVVFNSGTRPRGHRGVETIMLDVDTGRSKVIASGPGAEMLGETTYDDRWLIGAQRFRGQSPQFRVVRIKLPEGGMEPLPGVVGAQLLPNPRYPLFFTRQDHRNDPFQATRFWYDLDGTNQRIAVPTLQQCHMSWLGSGEYLLLGNGLVRGRKWNEPFPSNIHILASVAVGDISPCGASGRWVCGDSAVADLRSGDGWTTVEPLSLLCYPARVADDSGIYDADPKGSPDGTKVAFVSNYPLKDGPVTHLVRADPKAGRLVVESTEGFPAAGLLCVQREVIRYRNKTPTSFEGLTRTLFGTARVNLRPGRTITSFEARCLTDEQFRQLKRPNLHLAKSVGDANSPLMRQRMTDVYIVVVRRPDRPHLRLSGGRVQLIPGENHRETFGYHLLRDGRRITDQPLQPGSTCALEEPGRYQALAVEWSGLESEPSLPLEIDRAAGLTVLADPPADFSWTAQHWTDSSKTERVTTHLHDGVIRREWYEEGGIVRRDDLNLAGQTIRRVEFKGGKLARRLYFDRQGQLVSRELFDQQGFITQWTLLRTVRGRLIEKDHWYFDRGMPVRQVRAGREEYVKKGDRWGAYRNGRFVDLPRGHHSR